MGSWNELWDGWNAFAPSPWEAKKKMGIGNGLLMTFLSCKKS